MRIIILLIGIVCGVLSRLIGGEIWLLLGGFIIGCIFQHYNEKDTQRRKDNS